MLSNLNEPIRNVNEPVFKSSNSRRFNYLPEGEGGVEASN